MGLPERYTFFYDTLEDRRERALRDAEYFTGMRSVSVWKLSSEIRSTL